MFPPKVRRRHLGSTVERGEDWKCMQRTESSTNGEERNYEEGVAAAASALAFMRSSCSMKRSTFAVSPQHSQLHPSAEMENMRLTFPIILVQNRLLHSLGVEVEFISTLGRRRGSRSTSTGSRGRRTSSTPFVDGSAIRRSRRSRGHFRLDVWLPDRSCVLLSTRIHRSASFHRNRG